MSFIARARVLAVGKTAVFPIRRPIGMRICDEVSPVTFRAPFILETSVSRFFGQPWGEGNKSAPGREKAFALIPVSRFHDNLRESQLKLQAGKCLAIPLQACSVGRSLNPGNGWNSRVSHTRFKHTANYDETQRPSQRERAGSSAPAAARPPYFKPKANYYELLAKSKGESTSSSRAAARPPNFKPKANHYDLLAKSRGESTSSSRAAARPSIFKPKANYYELLAKSRGERTSSSRDHSGPIMKRRSILEKDRAHRMRRDGGAGVIRNSKASKGFEPYGYEFRNTATEVGQFRKIVSGTRISRDEGVRRVDGRGSLLVSGTRISRDEGVKRVDGKGSLASDDVDKDSSQSSWEKYPPKRLEGEKKWQYAVRKKHLGLAGHSRGATRKSKLQFVDEEQLGDEPQGEDWRRKKIAWLCKMIPTLRPRPVVTILNEQRKWINAEDVKYIVEHLLKIYQTLRAHRVLKWEMQQPWYEFDFDLSTKVAVQLGENNKLSRTKDIYDLIIQNGKVPTLPTYVALINCYIAEAENESLSRAWSLYNQLIQLGGYEPPPTLSYNLFQGLVQKGLTYLEQADELLQNMRTAGLVCSTEMYTLLILAHGTRGNRDRVNSMIEEMKQTGLPIGQEVYAAILKACAKDGNVAVGEQAFADLKMGGHRLIPSIYASLISMYGKAGLSEKASQAFDDMRDSGLVPNLIVYEPLIEIAASSGDRVQAEKLLDEAIERNIPSLHGCYNSLMRLYCKEGSIEDLEVRFEQMGIKGYPPNRAAYNIRLEAYVSQGLLHKAESLYEEMKEVKKAGPDKNTYELMIKLYGQKTNMGKLHEIFKELSDRKMEIPEGVQHYLEAAVSVKKLEAHRKSQLQLNREHREILAGVLLAGAGVESHDKDRTYEIHFALDPDSEVGRALLDHLFRLFSVWSTGTPRRRPLPDPKDQTKSKTLLAFQTVSHGSFRFFAHQYRPKHTPVIPRLVHRWLTPRALAYWYMYGGSKCPQTGDILFNVSAYSHKECMLVVNALKTRTIDCERISTKGGAVICFNGRSAIWLWGLMEPFILPEAKSLLMPHSDKMGEGLSMPRGDNGGDVLKERHDSNQVQTRSE